ncbi:hypothetical protein FTX61_04515 [Nitriliruptoraceae bacterium ZYF776]|nr:hypothetical protein [Profundirhabdus halotolerans]
MTATDAPARGSTDEAVGYERVLTGGRVYDGAGGPAAVADVAIRDGRVVAIGPDLAASASEVVDVRGKLVLPGLVDAHTHVFEKVSAVGAPPDQAHLRRGVVAAADAGTVGASTLAAFRSFVVDRTRMRLVNFLNVSVLGLIDFRFGELLNPATLVHADAVDAAAANPDLIRGFKIRLSEDVVGDRCLELLEQALDVGAETGLPLMVHIGETADPLPTILERLRPGDVVAHCYTGKPFGILDGDRVSDAVWQARERGVRFDSAHGRSNLAFRVAEPAIAQGFLPDYLTSDTSARNWQGPVFDLVTSISKLVALGAAFDDLVPLATSVPAAALGLDAEGFGNLVVGGPAHVTVLDEVADQRLVDTEGAVLEAPRYEPSLVLLGGDEVELTPWRGLAS